MRDIEKAKELLTGETTCVIVKGNITYVSKLKGIAPLFDFSETKGFSVADRIVGKAAALLFVKLGIKEIYGEVMSVQGKAILEKYGLPYAYSTLVDKIINRRGDDICPMEKAVQNIDDLEEAYKTLALANKQLNK